MSVESVNNNSNAGLYALGAAAIGGGAGAGAAYLTKPYLKDGAPTDAFIKKMDEKMTDALPEEGKQFKRELETLLENNKKQINEAKTVEDIKNLFIKSTTGHLTEETLAEQKFVSESVLENLQQLGIETKPEFIEEFKNTKTVEEVKTLMGKIFDSEYAGKNLDEIKQMINAESQKIERQAGKAIFEQFWDSGKKEFVNCEEGLGAAVKKAAKSIQGKYAMIYGAIGAAVLGIGTYLATRGKEASPEKIDA